MKRLFVVLATLAIVLPGVCFAGPFGFNYGMTKDQVIAIVGKDSVLKDQGYFLRVATAPEPDNAYEAYLLIISPKQGLLKIIATGKTIKSSEFGTEFLVGFKGMRDSVAAQYGAPDHDYSFVEPGSTFVKPSDWMEGLLKRQRKLASVWEFDPSQNKSHGETLAKKEHLVSIMLESKGLSKDSGWVEATYEFKGFEAFAISVNKPKPQ
jgi:hypothetical protein